MVAEVHHSPLISREKVWQYWEVMVEVEEVLIAASESL